MNTKLAGFFCALFGFIILGGLTLTQASEMDDRIESAIKDSYVFKNYLKTENVQINSQDGVVTLTGTVSRSDYKTLAEETIEDIPDVRRVENQIQVEGGEAEPSDAWLSVKVKSALLFHRDVSGLRTQVEVNDGVVTLRGEAESGAQRDLATEYVKDVEGVKEVNNQMTVQGSAEQDRSLGERIDDATITAQVKVALMAHRSTSGLGTNVDTENGVVTLTGTAKSESEKTLASKIASDVKGVKRVVNSITVVKESY